MTDYKLEPTLPLGGDSPQINDFDGLVIRENPDLYLTSLAKRAHGKQRFATIAKDMFGCPLPKPGIRATSLSHAVFWSGPGQWFIESNAREYKTIAAAFGENASVTDQSGGWVIFDIHGPNVLSMLERLCQLDIHAFKRGTAARTIVEHIGVFVLCLENDSFRIIGPRSSAASLHHALCTAARSVS